MRRWAPAAAVVLVLFAAYWTVEGAARDVRRDEKLERIQADVDTLAPLVAGQSDALADQRAAVEGLRQEVGRERERADDLARRLGDLQQRANRGGGRSPIGAAEGGIRRGGSLGRFEATCYALTPKKGGQGGPGSIAVDPRVIPLGTKLWVEGYGAGAARDTGGAIKGRRVDVWLSTDAACLKWGRRMVEVRVVG